MFCAFFQHIDHDNNSGSIGNNNYKSMFSAILPKKIADFYPLDFEYHYGVNYLERVKKWKRIWYIETELADRRFFPCHITWTFSVKPVTYNR